MKDETILKPHLSSRCTPSGYLPTILFNLLAIIQLSFVNACTKISDGAADMVTVAEPAIQVDSVRNYLFIRSGEQLDRVDLFVYPASPSVMSDSARQAEIGRKMEKHIVIDSRPFVAELVSAMAHSADRIGNVRDNDKVILAIGNATAIINAEMMKDFENAERAIVRHASVIPLSAEIEYTPGKDMTITMEQMAVRITVRSISNLNADYTVIENPVLYLTNINASTELFRRSGFFPSETLDSSDTLKFDYDIGMFTQYPAKSLTCLPDESAGTSIILECTIKNSRCRFEKNPGPLSRGSELLLDYELLSKDIWNCRIVTVPRR